MDALAQQRRAEGRPATALAWGLWEETSEMTAHLGEADLERMRRAGMPAIADKQGLELFDSSAAFEPAHLLAAPIERGALAAAARAGVLPPLLSGLVRTRVRRAASAGTLARRLAALPEAEREDFAVELVRAEAATVLGHSSPQAIDPERAFKELGFDSLAGVELRNRLAQASGLTLPATLVFDQPTVRAVGRYLVERVGDDRTFDSDISSALDMIETLLISAGREEKRQASDRLRSLLGVVSRVPTEAVHADSLDDLDSPSDAELLEMIDREFGSS
jgi:acyl carrier protein